MNVLILSCTAVVHKNVEVARNKSEERINDYLRAMDFWSSIKLLDKIIVVDNSGYDFSAHRSYYSPKFEFYKFNANGSYDPKLGKGYGEYLILKYALENSVSIKSAKKIFKCTGRYALKNASALIDDCVRKDAISADFSRNLSWIDSRFFCVTPSFFEVGFHLLGDVDESQDLHMEVCLARAVHACMANGCQWQLLTDTPIYIGYYGAENTMYTQNRFKILCKSLMKKIKILSLNIRY